jgi:L-ascorbate metabolism protein UlaG (beta-lactamase superfamily)
MRARWLGWAGVEVEHDGVRILIDPLIGPRAVFAAAGDAATRVEVPALVDPADGAPAAAALVSHLHRDHTDADALSRSLAGDAPILGPRFYPGQDDLAEVGIAQARSELEATGLVLTECDAWQRREVGPFTITALPAADGTGDPQLSWAVEAGGRRIIHLGDTMFHGWWWRMARFAGPFDAAFVPINGAVLSFPWRQPPSPFPGAMTAAEAVVAAMALGARRAVPIHFGGFDFEPFYRSDTDALPRFLKDAERESVTAHPLELGGSLELGAPAAAPA